MLIHATVSGNTLELDPTPDVAALLERLTSMLSDPKVTTDEMIATIYSPANPIMDAEMMPPHGMVTKATWANPAYHVMADLLYRKQAGV